MIAIDDRYCKGCGICIRFCPKDVLELRKDVNSRGFYVPCVIDEGRCNKCRQCELFCPDFAIFITEEEEGGDR